MYVAIVGNEDSGKTIFVSLLYAAQIKYSEDSAGDFRFYSEPKVLKILGNYYNRLRGGFWPKKKFTKHITFTFGYGLNSMGSKIRRIFDRSGDEPKIALKFGIFDLYSKTKNANVSPKIDALVPKLLKSPYFKYLSRARIILILLDSTKLGHDTETDMGISKIIEKAYRISNTPIYPIIVFTKFDSVKREKLKKLKISSEPPSLGDGNSRKEYGSKILKQYYPKIESELTRKDPVYYFVHLNVETDPHGKSIPAVPKNLEFEIDYSYEEYRDLIEHLGMIGKLDMNVKQ